MKPTFLVNPRAIDVIEMDDMLSDFMATLYIYNYIGGYKVWRLCSGMGDVHNAFWLVLYKFVIYIGQRFYGGRGMLFLVKKFRGYCIGSTQ